MTGLMGNTRVSAVIPVGDFESHKENIKQILEQVNGNAIEVILVLDCQSRVDTLEAKSLLSNLGVSGYVLEVTCGNPGGARNAGLEAAKNEWVVFWDCDDFPYATNYLKLINEALVNGSNMAIGNFATERIGRERIGNQKISQSHWQTQVGLNPGIWRMAFSRDLIQEVRFPELSMGEDQVFIARVMLREPSVYICNIIVYQYRIGVARQLTKNLERVKELRFANSIIISESKSLTKNKTLVAIMIIRQTVTMIKNQNENPEVKFSLYLRILKSFIKRPYIVLSVIRMKLSEFSRG
jgi:glycosyltransferase involved in cell wall biosynthesis